MDLSFRKAIEIVMDTLNKPDESVVAKNIKCRGSKILF